MAARHGRVVAAREQGELRGVLIALPPQSQPLLLPPLLERLRVALLQGPIAASRWAWVAEQLQELRPIELHSYLSILGVEASQRGRGVGSALLAGFVEEADREALPTYLETDVESNIGFYARLGFTVVGDLRVLGVPVWRMWRPVRPPETA
jgi:GNAT superfamily N-acetyltransferase